MVRRAPAIAVAIGCTAVVAASATAGPQAQRVSGAATVACANGIQIGMMAPITGAAASIGGDQLHWAQFYAAQWNKSHKLQLKIVQGDTQLDPSKASVVAQRFASNASIMGIIGPAGSQEVIASSPILKRAGLATVSGSATRVSLTDGKLKGYFFRVVPNDGVQGPTVAKYMQDKLGVSSGSKVMIVDDQEAYSTGLADIVGSNLQAAGVTVGRESISQQATDFSALVAKVDSATKVVFLPFQLSSQAQLFAQQMKAQGKTQPVFGSDGTFDSAKFNVDGSYISFFAPDITTLPKAASTVKAFHQQFKGATSPFGAPNYVAAQVYAAAATRACADGQISRNELRERVGKVYLPDTVFGTKFGFTAKGDQAAAKFHVFQITGGKYKTVQ